MMKMKCTDEVISLRRMVSAYANTYHVIAIISPYHEISNDTDLTISFVRFEPRTQHPVSDVVSPRSYRYWAVVSSGTGNSICYDHMYMYCNVDETCSLTMCSISKTEDRFLVVFVKKFYRVIKVIWYKRCILVLRSSLFIKRAFNVL